MSLVGINIEEFVKGGCIGVIQTGFGHPLDTMKTLKQYSSVKHKNVTSHGFTMKGLFSGMSYPLMVNVIYNSGVFGIYSWGLQHEIETSASGFIAGGIMSFLLNPFEYHKVQQQMKGNMKVRDISPMFLNVEKFKRRERLNKIIDFWKNGYVGIQYTFLRDSFATGIYFKTYEMMKTWGASPFFAGGIAGCNSWLLTYPIDTMKTRYQLDTRMDWKVTLRRGGLFDGLAFCLLRAFLVNGISFTFYEMV